jgi:hypothetical protein
MSFTLLSQQIYNSYLGHLGYMEDNVSHSGGGSVYVFNCVGAVFI